MKEKIKKNSSSGSFSRRKFINITSTTVGGMLINGRSDAVANQLFDSKIVSAIDNQPSVSLIGVYSSWASNLLKGEIPSLSFRRKEWPKIDEWHKAARKRTIERLAIPEITGVPEVKINKQYT